MLETPGGHQYSHLTVCTFAGLSTILDAALSCVFTHDHLQAPVISVDHPRVTSMQLNNACNILRLCSALSCRRVILEHSVSFLSLGKTNLRGQS